MSSGKRWNIQKPGIFRYSRIWVIVNFYLSFSPNFNPSKRNWASSLVMALLLTSYVTSSIMDTPQSITFSPVKWGGEWSPTHDWVGDDFWSEMCCIRCQMWQCICTPGSVKIMRNTNQPPPSDSSAQKHCRQLGIWEFTARFVERLSWAYRSHVSI